MAAMKPRTGDGPLEVTKEGRGIVMRVPLEGGGRLVVEMSAPEATALSEALKAAAGWASAAWLPGKAPSRVTHHSRRLRGGSIVQLLSVARRASAVLQPHV